MGSNWWVSRISADPDLCRRIFSRKIRSPESSISKQFNEKHHHHQREPQTILLTRSPPKIIKSISSLKLWWANLISPRVLWEQGCWGFARHKSHIDCESATLVPRYDPDILTKNKRNKRMLRSHNFLISRVQIQIAVSWYSLCSLSCWREVHTGLKSWAWKLNITFSWTSFLTSIANVLLFTSKTETSDPFNVLSSTINNCESATPISNLTRTGTQNEK